MLAKTYSIGNTISLSIRLKISLEMSSAQCHQRHSDGRPGARPLVAHIGVAMSGESRPFAPGDDPCTLWAQNIDKGHWRATKDRRWTKE
jgi:hypothetical protein